MFGQQITFGHRKPTTFAGQGFWIQKKDYGLR